MTRCFPNVTLRKTPIFRQKCPSPFPLHHVFPTGTQRTAATTGADRAEVIVKVEVVTTSLVATGVTMVIAMATVVVVAVIVTEMTTTAGTETVTTEAEEAEDTTEEGVVEEATMEMGVEGITGTKDTIKETDMMREAFSELTRKYSLVMNFWKLIS